MELDHYILVERKNGKKMLILWVITLISIALVYMSIENRIDSLSQDISKDLDFIRNSFISTSQEFYNSLNSVNETFDKRINELNSKIETLGERVRILEDKVRQKGLVNPSYYDLIKFVYSDDTDKLEYVSENNKFICTDFANTFISRLRKLGYYSCDATLYLYDMDNFKEVGHTIVVVNTTDEGLIFIEPQDDTIIRNLKEGDDYCLKVGWGCHMIIKNIKTCFDYV